ncbi:DUF2784 domain-containing protein [Solimonas sp. K1W22B-7]|uniref:DUF2784 domain-containing protein n=1 Tax=Solimonas sp. K1W22B-7 TaxID=2303331 RepID=UPI000E3363E0|nr:DUF2784 domain-containing protein [Solimonas sp. K1W22B-7]AXQ31563.1 DUF2784 domain-containing protein [Solimonas sp. K1W22B-7]
MLYALLADAVVAFHFCFILFAVFGGLLAAWRWKLRWLHLPALAWAAGIISLHGICPLTPLENHFRELAGQQGYAGGFIDHYLLPLIYPPGLTPATQLWLAVLLVTFNAGLYLWAWRRRPRR